MNADMHLYDLEDRDLLWISCWVEDPQCRTLDPVLTTMVPALGGASRIMQYAAVPGRATRDHAYQVQHLGSFQINVKTCESRRIWPNNDGSIMAFIDNTPLSVFLEILLTRLKPPT